ncbi:MAG: glycine oxidase ThiO [Candidatus Acidiferrales bacterium]
MNSYDAIIVGGGIIGASIAWELSRKKLRILVLDRREPGREASWAAAGMLSPAPDSADALPLFPFARESFALYPEFIAAVEAATGIPTGFRREGTLEIFFGLEGESSRERLLAEHPRLGLTTETISLESARKMEPALSPEISAALWLPEEYSVEPRALTRAVLAAAAREAVEIRADTAVLSLLLDSQRIVGVATDTEKFSAAHVIIAAGCYSAQIEGLAALAPVRPARGQMVGLAPASPLLTRVLRSEHGYLVPRNSGEIAAGSTIENAGFEITTTHEGVSGILRSAVALVPALRSARINETWAGLRPGTPDHLPIIGPADRAGLILATGHYRNGILLAPATARAVADLVTEGATSFPVAEFSPLRFARTHSRATQTF